MALIYFLTSDLVRAVQEAEEAGWMRIAINRWATPDRNDVRIVSGRREVQFIPGGTLILPARDLASLASRVATARRELGKAADAIDRTNEDSKARAAALMTRDGAQRRLDDLGRVLADVLYIKDMVEQGLAQWIGNPLLGDEKTHDLIASLQPLPHP